MKAHADHRYLEFIAQLRTERKRLGISQKTLAMRLGKPQSYMSKVESGERRLDLIETLTICEALGISLEKILPAGSQHLLKRRLDGENNDKR
jgi:transcriptional regulator with XRE-family HTH domain